MPCKSSQTKPCRSRNLPTILALERPDAHLALHRCGPDHDRRLAPDQDHPLAIKLYNPLSLLYSFEKRTGTIVIPAKSWLDAAIHGVHADEGDEPAPFGMHGRRASDTVRSPQPPFQKKSLKPADAVGKE